jgi:hypothetical protein
MKHSARLSTLLLLAAAWSFGHVEPGGSLSEHPASGRQILADELPKPVKGDPEGGIDVPGGKVHRGTGTYVNPENPDDKRAAFYLWTVAAANSDCKDWKWYQFVKAEAKVNYGSGDRDVTAALAKEGAIKTAIGSEITFGKWSGDYDKNEEKKRKEKKLPKLPHEKMPGSKPPVDAGPYLPKPIPGANGAEGLIDAPNWGKTGGWGRLLKRLSGPDAPKNKTGEEKPSDLTATMVITETFRDYLFCEEPKSKCLGYSEETYTETLKFKVTWVESGTELGGPSNTVWKATPGSLESDESTVTFGDWKACP